MVPTGNKAKRHSSVNPTTKTVQFINSMKDMLENWDPRPTRPLAPQDPRDIWDLGPL